MILEHVVVRAGRKDICGSGSEGGACGDGLEAGGNHIKPHSSGRNRSFRLYTYISIFIDKSIYLQSSINLYSITGKTISISLHIACIKLSIYLPISQQSSIYPYRCTAQSSIYLNYRDHSLPAM